MRARFADSLAYALRTLGLDAQHVDERVEDIRLVPQSPQVFGLYHDIVSAIGCGERGDASALASDLWDHEAQVGGPVVRALDDRPTAEADRCRRLLLGDAAYGRPRSPAPERDAAARARIEDALALLEVGAQELAGEVRALVREIVLAVDSPDAPRGFGGASAFMLWGAVLLNADRFPTPLSVALALAHESGHLILLGYGVDAPLTEGDAEARHRSPLRDDPRPMDGLVHAAWVTARERLTLTRLLAGKALDPPQRAEAARALAVRASAFAEADAVVRSEGRLTPLGLRVMQSARAYMADPR